MSHKVWVYRGVPSAKASSFKRSQNRLLKGKDFDLGKRERFGACP